MPIEENNQIRPTPKLDDPEILAQIHQLFRDYFDRAERKRRWNLQDDIPWKDCNHNLNPAISNVVETFCAVELYLPDYLSKLIPQVRANPGRAWMLANWGYEESKHSMALGDWLLKSRQRSDEQMTDMSTTVFAHEWDIPYDNARAMVCYTTLQELATWLHYHNLQKIVGNQDPALARALSLISIDERAHYDFFRRMFAIYLAYDRPGTLEQMRRVVLTFQMPATHLLAESQQRIALVKSLGIFDEKIFYYEVLERVLKDLDIPKQDLRVGQRTRKSLATSNT